MGAHIRTGLSRRHIYHSFAAVLTVCGLSLAHPQGALAQGKNAGAVKEHEKDYSRYRRAADEQHDRMRALLMREFSRRKSKLRVRYDQQIRVVSKEQRKRQTEAMALLRRFLEEHPNHPKYTPDIMFRLADLHLDASEADAEAKVDAGQLDALADYSESINLWQSIVDRFPKYRQLGGILYLLAYYGQSVDERRSLQLYLALVCSNKYPIKGDPPAAITPEEARKRLETKSLVNPYEGCRPVAGADNELVNHAWVRGVGDTHFATPGEMDEAIAGYSKAVVREGSELYDEALYKLAWAYFRRDFLPDAIRRFDKSVIRFDTVVAQGKKPSLELREEALQYVAVSFTDPWDGEVSTDPVRALQRAEEFYRGRENEPHVRDVWVTIGRAFMDLQTYDQAVSAYNRALSRPWQLHPDNPRVQEEIVAAYEAKGDKYAADEAAAKLATHYAPCPSQNAKQQDQTCGAWFEANESNPKAMKYYRSIGEDMLGRAARNAHAMAASTYKEWNAADPKDNELRKQLKEDYTRLYASAADRYRSFLTRYPQSDHIYEHTYYLAETLYFSGKYAESVDHYRWVRDHRNLSEKLFEPAARSIVQAYEQEAKRLVASGQLKPLSAPTKEQLDALPQPIQQETVPPIYLKLRDAYVEYQQMVNDPKRA